MKNPADTDIHTKGGVAPYPTPKSATTAARPGHDEATSPPDASFECSEAHAEGDNLDAVDAMKKTLKDGDDLENWRKGRTQGGPSRDNDEADEAPESR